jgi:RNA polymerase sigma factor (sigma-70 family)
MVRHLKKLLAGPQARGLSDGQLLERFVQFREEAAFEVLLERHGPLVWAVCRRMLRRPHDAEDAFQATFLTLARRAAAIRKPESVSCWLYGVAYRTARRALARGVQRSHEKASAPVPPSPDVLAEVATRELCVLLDEELNRLPERYRDPLVLCYLQGLLREEAAQRLGWSVGTLKRRLEAGRERLRHRLTRRGVTLGAALLAPELAPAAEAAVPPGLASATVRMAAVFPAGAAAPFPVAALTDGVLRAMFLSRVRSLAALLLLLAALTVGGGVLARQARETAAPGEARPEQEAQTPARAEPEEKVAVRADPLGDPLPPGAVTRLGTQRFRTGGTVAGLAFSPDGKLLASASRTAGLRLWDALTGRALRPLAEPPDDAEGVVFSPDGKLLAAASGEDDTVRLWEVTTGQVVRRWTAERGVARSVAFAPDGKFLATGGADRMIRLWDPATGKLVWKQEGHEGIVSVLRFNRNGELLLSGCLDEPLTVWDGNTGQKLSTLGQLAHPSMVAVYPKDKTVAWVNRGLTLRLADFGTGQMLRVIPLKEKPREDEGALALSPDGRTLAASQQRSIQLWEVSTGLILDEWEAHGRSVTALAFSPDGRTIASGSGDRTVRLWKAATGKPLRPLPGHGGAAGLVAVSPDGRNVATAGEDGSVRLWDLLSGRPLREWEGPIGGRGGALAFSADGRYLTCVSKEGRTWKVDLKTPDAQPYRNHVWNSGESVALTPDGLVLVQKQGVFGLFDVAANGVRRWEAPPIDPQVGRAACSPDGKLVATLGARGSIYVWDLSTGKQVATSRPPEVVPSVVAFSPSSTSLATGGDNQPVLIWEASTGKLLRSLRAEPLTLRALAFSPDGKALATGGPDGVVRLWDLATGQELRHWTGHQGAVLALAFTPDGKHLISGSADTTALVWEVSGR